MFHGEEYSPWKGAHWIDRLHEVSLYGRTVPVHVQIVPTNQCNQNCVFCAYRKEGHPSSQLFNPDDRLTPGQLIGIVTELAGRGVRAVQFTGGGEPLLSPETVGAMWKACSLGLKTALVTNGTMLEQRGILDWAADRLSWIRISLDAATADTYAQIHGTGQALFGRVIRAIARLSRIPDRKATVGVGFVVSGGNWTEVYEAARLVKDLGADNIRISYDITRRAPPHKGMLEQTSKAEELSGPGFRVFNLLEDRARDVVAGDADCGRCVQRELVTYIGADARVYSCCVLAYNRKGDLGPIGEKGENFWEVWRSWEPAASHKGDCTGAVCMFNEKNRFLRYLMKEHPKHVEFV